MIPQAAVDKFLARERRDLRVCLAWTEADAIAFAKANRIRKPPYYDGMWLAQKITTLLAIADKRFAVFNDLGTGKTLVFLSFAAHFKRLRGSRFLLLVRNKTNIDEWLRGIKKQAPDLTVTVLPADSTGKIKLALEADTDLVMDTFAGFQAMCSELVNRKGGGRRRVIDAKIIRKLRKRFDGVLADESDVLGNQDALCTRCVYQVTQEPEKMLLLATGTPFGVDPARVWSQMKLVDFGYSLGETLGLFRGVFYTKSLGRFGVDYKYQKRKSPVLERCLADRSIRFPLDELTMKVPKGEPTPIMLDLPADAGVYMKAAKALLKKAKGDLELSKNAFMRTRQIASGFMNVSDDETGEKSRIVFADNPKLDELIYRCGQVGSHQVVIFHDFIYSGGVIMNALKKLGVTCGLINGQSKDRREVYRDFTEGKIQYLALNSYAGAFGLNLQMARYAMFYEIPVPVVVRKQALHRIQRPGSEFDTVHIYDLVMRSTYDQAILDTHRTGANIFAAIFKGQAELST